MIGFPLIAAVMVALVLGGALAASVASERRRKSLGQRISGVAIAGRRARPAAAPASIRRPQLRLRRYFLPADVRAAFDAAYAATGNRVGPTRVTLIGATTVAVIVIGGRMTLGFSLPVLFAIGLAAAVAAAVSIVKAAQGQFQREFLDAFPEALDLIIRAVKAGLPVLDAMNVAAQETPAPVGPEFQRLIDEMRIGVDMDVAMRRAADRVRVPDFQFFVITLELQRRTGGALAETLSNLSAIIRGRKALRNKTRALSAETKASAWVLALLPPLAAGGLFAINHSLMASLFSDPRGRFMIGLALTNLVIGIVVMSTMIRKMLK
jgi:tight adherence protein B